MMQLALRLELSGIRYEKWPVLHCSRTEACGVNPYDGTVFGDTASAFVTAFLHLLSRRRGLGKGTVPESRLPPPRQDRKLKSVLKASQGVAEQSRNIDPRLSCMQAVKLL
jgi:hypothetical protein